VGNRATLRAEWTSDDSTGERFFCVSPLSHLIGIVYGDSRCWCTGILLCGRLVPLAFRLSCSETCSTMLKNGSDQATRSQSRRSAQGCDVALHKRRDCRCSRCIGSKNGCVSGLPEIARKGTEIFSSRSRTRTSLLRPVLPCVLLRLPRGKQNLRILAEGDSWFEYPCRRRTVTGSSISFKNCSVMESLIWLTMVWKWSR
jgi:hypothetical protein